MKEGRFIFVFFVLLAFGCIFPYEISAKTFPIGGLWPMTGPQAYYGRVMSQGAMSAIQQVNDAGGIEGYKFELVISDFKKADVNLAVTGMRKMISIDKVPAVLPALSVTILAVQPICAKANVVMINGGAYSPDLLNKPYLHTIRLAQNQMVPPMLKYFWKTGARRLAVSYMANPAGIVPAEQYVKPLWTKMGGTIVAMEPHEMGVTDYSAYLARIKAGNPDAIMDFSSGQDSAYMIKGAREMGLTCPMAVSDWNADYQAITGNTSENVYNCIELFDRKSSDRQIQAFVKEYEGKWKESPDFFAANYYDAVYNILTELIKRVVQKGGNPLNGAQLEEAIWTDPSFKTIYGGTMKLKRDGSVIKVMGILKVVKGELTVIEKVPGEE